MIILASQSPRRRELLAGLGVDFKLSLSFTHKVYKLLVNYLNNLLSRK